MTKRLSDELRRSIEEYISAAYGISESISQTCCCSASYRIPEPPRMEMCMPCSCSDTGELASVLNTVGETFSQMTMRLIRERGWEDAECYKRAGIDRKHFGKIRNNPEYQPKKRTAIAIALALELPLETAQELLRTAGYTLSRSSKADLIVEYFIKNGKFNLMDINIALEEFGQPVLA